MQVVSFGPRGQAFAQPGPTALGAYRGGNPRPNGAIVRPIEERSPRWGWWFVGARLPGPLALAGRTPGPLGRKSQTVRITSILVFPPKTPDEPQIPGHLHEHGHFGHERCRNAHGQSAAAPPVRLHHFDRRPDTGECFDHEFPPSRWRRWKKRWWRRGGLRGSVLQRIVAHGVEQHTQRQFEHRRQRFWFGQQ